MKFSKFNLIITDEKTGKIILFNTLQGNCIEIEEELKELIDANEITKIDVENSKMFERLGIIINDNVD